MAELIINSLYRYKNKPNTKVYVKTLSDIHMHYLVQELSIEVL